MKYEIDDELIVKLIVTKLYTDGSVLASTDRGTRYGIIAYPTSSFVVKHTPAPETPKIGDLFVGYATGITYIVLHVDETTCFCRYISNYGAVKYIVTSFDSLLKSGIYHKKDSK